MKTTFMRVLYVVLFMASMLTFTEGVDDKPTVFNFIGVACMAILSYLLSRKENKI